MRKLNIAVLAMTLMLSSCSTSAEAAKEPLSESTATAISSTEVPGIQIQPAEAELSRDEKWIEDIFQMKEFYVTRHPEPFHYTSEAAFNAKIDELIENVPKLSDFTILCSVNLIVNSMRDAHSNISLEGINRGFFEGIEQQRYFPFGVVKVKDKYYVNCITQGYRHLWGEILGRQITAINGRDIEEIDEALYEFLPSDFGNRRTMNPYITSSFTPSLLEFLGFPISNIVWVTFCQASGETFTVEFENESYPLYEIVQPVMIPFSEGEEKFGFTVDDEHELFKIDYNTCYHPEDFANFLDDAFEVINSAGYHKLVIDLRRNTGGESMHVDNILKHVRKWFKSDRNNQLYLLISDMTFSAGVYAAYQLDRVSGNSTLVGGVTGGAINPFSVRADMESMELKERLHHSGIVCAVSDESTGLLNYALLPDVYAENSMEDYINGLDAAMEWIYQQ